MMRNKKEKKKTAEFKNNCWKHAYSSIARQDTRMERKTIHSIIACVAAARHW